MLTAADARDIMLAKCTDGRHSKESELQMRFHFILQVIEDLALRGYDSYCWNWLWSNENIWMIEPLKEKLRELGYMVNPTKGYNHIVSW